MSLRGGVFGSTQDLFDGHNVNYYLFDKKLHKTS